MKLHRNDNYVHAGANQTAYFFHCPGCECAHAFLVTGPLSWEFNGDLERPTFSPSLLCTTRMPSGNDVCHLFMRDGQIEFLSDCTHKLAGRTVPVPDWDGGS